MSDIRILKSIAPLTDVVDGFRTELNVVSVDNGPAVFDIREWSLDYSWHGEGISLDDVAMKRLFAELKRTFPNGGDDISVDTVPALSRTMPATAGDDEIITFLKECGIEPIDKRASGGAIWFVGGHEWDELAAEAETKGYKFSYSEKGGRATKHQPGWFGTEKK